MNKIAFFETNPWEEEPIKDWAKKLGADVFDEEVENAVSTAKDYEIISCFIYSDCSEKILKQLPRLKMIATRSTGADHIDTEFCRKKNIVVASVPHYGENTVAEHTFALILSLSRRITECVERVRQGGFSPVGLTGFDLKDKTIGVVGVGSIGQYVIRIAKGFDMKVLGVARTPDPALSEKLGFKYVNLEEAARQSDILTLHLPLTKETFHLINREMVKKMKPGITLINTSRGPIIESETLLWGLEEKIIAGAGLDVLEEEESLDEPGKLFDPYLSKDDLSELVAAHLLREKPNVVITPHNAFNTKEAIARIVKTTAENIQSFLKTNH